MGDIKSGHWFADLIMTLAPTDMQIVDGEKPEAMTSSASWKAFTISTAAALPPGPFGLATILPEMIAITKLQINLVYSIAKYYGKEKKINSTIVMLIFANQAGIAIGKNVARKYAGKMIIRALGTKTLRPIAQKVGAIIGTKLTSRFVGRWIPFILAPIFGAWSKSMTTDIGNEAMKLFADELEIVESAFCQNGHEVSSIDKFCPECGIAI